MKKVVACRLPANCSISNVNVLRQELAQLLSHKTKLTVTLNGVDVQKVDSAGIQILYAFVAGLKAKGGQCKWMEPSTRLLKSAELLGMARQLELP